jgi:hypothetical protein
MKPVTTTTTTSTNAVDTNPKRNVPMLMVLLIWSILTLGADIAALIIAFRNAQPCAGLASLGPRTFLLVGAFTNIGAFILLLYMFFLLFERIRNDVAFIQAAPVGFLIMMVGLFTFAWGITGIILYTQNGCKHGQMGRMVISWSIIKLASVLFQLAASGNLREDVFVVAYN